MTYLWAMNGAATTGASGFTSALADTSWEVVGTGDLDGDRRADLLWRKSGTGPGGGTLVAWLMDGRTVASVGVVGWAGPTWAVQGVGDFNGDGRADILWRETTSGSTYIWFMNATAISSAAFTQAFADPTWTIQGVGNLDGDAADDVVWRHSSGALYVWLMDGANLAPGSALLPPIGLTWQIQALGDHDGDGRADILWRETASGATYLWRMNGATAIGQGYTSAQVDNGWTVQAR
jgi:hypothetical protein